MSVVRVVSERKERFNWACVILDILCVILSYSYNYFYVYRLLHRVILLNLLWNKKLGGRSRETIASYNSNVTIFTLLV